MMELKNIITCDQVENLTEEEVKTLTNDTEVIKGFNIYFIDFENHFKYSALVFKNGKQIYYANFYELHYSSYNGDKEKLRAFYIKGLKKRLYTEKELLKPVKNYDDYELKRYFLCNYYSMQFEHISIFFIGSDKEREERRKQTEKMYFSKSALAYFPDLETVKKIESLSKALEEAREKQEKSYEYMYKAFLKELWNHEYIINWQGDWDIFSCFGRVEYGENKTPDDYMNELKMNDDQKKAFYDARKEYKKKALKYC